MKDTLCSYYTESEDITSYMVSKVTVSDGDVILEPSAGEGIFIDELLKTNKSFQIDALDINKAAIEVLKEKYKHNSSISVRQTDTLLDEELNIYEAGTIQLWLKQADALLDGQLDFFESIGGHYNKVIGNPPYGAWQDYEKRDLLKKKYAGHYVKETYSLFLLRCISVLKINGRLSFIIPDTYLFLNMHKSLRRLLLTKTKIEEILIFPSKFFPGVSFGYSNLSIITLERSTTDSALKNTVRIIRGFKDSSEFKDLLNHEQDLPAHLEVFNLNQKSIFENEDSRFILAGQKTTSMLQSAKMTLGDVADIVTGFYTGDNLRFIKAARKSVKGAKRYDIADSSEIFNCNSLTGIPGISKGYIPYIKSSSKQRYIREKDEWFVRWDEDTIKFYNNNKKSRFQNSGFYFKTGIGIPMVKSSTIRAFLMENRVFDQSIVGIFPHDDSKLNYFLALMNSDSINTLIHIINPTANNSANYVKQIPYLEPNKDTLVVINTLVEEIKAAGRLNNTDKINSIHEKLNAIISNIYSQKQY
nr:N-6 DNA methylase [uncultured Anaerobutyricum sp.]